MKNQAAAVRTRLIRNIHGEYIANLSETMGWSEESIVEMFVLCDGDISTLREEHGRWIKKLNVKPDELGRGHDALRSFLGYLHAEHDRAVQAAKEVRRRLLRSNYADFIARIQSSLQWKEDEILDCLMICGTSEAFETLFARWFESKERPQAGPVGKFAANFCRFVKLHAVPARDE